MKRLLSAILILTMMLSVMPVISMADASDAPFADATAEMPENLIKAPKNASLWYTNPTYTNSVTYQTKNEWTADGYAGYGYKTTGTVTPGTGYQQAAGARLVANQFNENTYSEGENYVIRFAARSLTEGVGIGVRVGIWNGLYSGRSTDVSQLMGYENGIAQVPADGSWTTIKGTFPALTADDVANGRFPTIILGMAAGTPADTIVEFNSHYAAIPDDVPYYAKEALYSVNVESDNPSAESGDTIELSAQVLNQVGTTGTLDQTGLNWYVTNEARTEKIETGFTFSGTSDNMTLSVAADVAPGTYCVVAESTEDSSIRKGINIEVLVPQIEDYVPGGEAVPGTAYDITLSRETVQSAGYTVHSTIKLSAALTDDAGALDGIEQNISYKVLDGDRRYEVESGINILEDENNNATVTFDADLAEGTYYIWAYNEDNTDMGRLFEVVINNEHTDYVPTTEAKDGAYDVALTRTSEQREYYTSLNELRLCAELKDETGSLDGIEQDIEWRILAQDKKQIVTEGITITEVDSNNVSVAIDAALPEGTYYIWAYNGDETEMGRLFEVVVNNSQLMPSIIAELNDTAATGLKDNLPKYLPYIDAQNTLYEKADKDNLDAVIKEMAAAGEVFTSANLAENFKMACILSLHNVPSADVPLNNADGSLVFETELGINTIDAQGADLYGNVYKNLITAEGRSAVLATLANAKTKQDFVSVFAETVLLKAISHTIYSGSADYVNSILTAENLQAAGITATNYLAAADKSPYADDIAYKTLTKADLETALAKTYTSGGTGTGSGGTGTGSGGGVSGGGSSSSSSGGSSSGGTTPSVKGPTVAVDTDNSNTQNTTKPDISFADLSEDHWAFVNIQFLAKLGIFEGDDKGNFNPEKAVTKEEFAKILVVAFDLTGTTDKSFADVQSGAWYEKYVKAAAANGVITGKDDGSLGVGEPVSREDMCVMIARVLGMGDGAEGTLTYSDKDSISPYAQSAVGYLSLLSMINGMPDNTFRPREACTRSQTARVIADIINYDVMEVNGK